MKAILMSIRPQYVAKILNGEKTIEIRKKFPKDYVGWVYIYCTKDKKNTFVFSKAMPLCFDKSISKYICGKVVARFWCDKVEHIEYETCSRDISGWWKDNGEMFNHKSACLNYEEMFDYIGAGEGYAIHITKLEIFDKSKELSEFHKANVDIKRCDTSYCDDYYTCGKCKHSKLTRAPQSWCYIETEELE